MELSEYCWVERGFVQSYPCSWYSSVASALQRAMMTMSMSERAYILVGERGCRGGETAMVRLLSRRENLEAKEKVALRLGRCKLGYIHELERGREVLVARGGGATNTE